MNVATPEAQKKKLDMVFIVTIIILFAVIFIMTFFLSKTAGSVPRMISIAGIVLSVISLFTKPKAKVRRGSEEDGEEEGGIPFRISIGLIVGYLIAMYIFGFFLSTMTMIFTFAFLMGYKRHIVNVTFSLITTAVLYILFCYVFYVRLPVGFLFELFI